MTTSGDGTGRSVNPRQEVPSTVAPAAGSGSQRGAETVPAGGPVAALPEQFGPYRVKKKLGGGGMGAVYLVENTALRRDEALKVPHFDTGDDPSVRQRFVQEAQAAAALKHPNLCPVFHVGEQDGIHFLTMPYLEGKPLSDYTGRPQPPRKSVEVVAKLAQALAAAHARGVIHRDLKPNNIMMCAGLGPVVMDFGLSRQVRQQDQRLTQSGTALGTPAYMPPEQIRGELERMGPASDVYSLGVILFELLTGHLPFEGGTMAEVFGKTLYTEAPPPAAVRPGLNPALDAVCGQALAKAPEQRYPTMKAFAAALFEYLRVTPPTEGTGNLVPSKPGVAKILQAPTVPPSQAPPPAGTAPRAGAIPSTVAPGKAPTGATRPGGKAPSSVRRPARPPGDIPEATLIAAPKEEKRGGRSWGLILGCAACVVLVLTLAGAGGVVALVYALNAKKQDLSSEEAVVTPIGAPPGPADASPVEPRPAEPRAPAETKTVQPRPVEQPRPAETKAPAETKVVEPRPAETKPEEPRPAETKPPAETGPAAETKPAEPRAPVEVKPPAEPRPAAPKPDDPEGSVLLREDFKGVDVGGRPKGWEGDAFAVQRENDRPCLEVTNPTGLHYVTLPKLAIKGDFVLECEFRLGGSNATARAKDFFGGGATGHEFHLELGSLTSTPLTVLVDYLGDVRLGDGQTKEADGFKAFENIRFRLTRKDDVYNVSINDRVTVGATIPGKGKFEEVRLGLPGGKVQSYTGGNFVARLYSVKIVSLSKDVEKPSEAGPPPGFREDFGKVAVGTLPDGWTKTPLANLAVQNTGAQPGLELLNPARGPDAVELPRVELKGDFFADFAVVFPETDGLVTVLFKGAKARVEVQMNGRGLVGGPGLRPVDASKSWNPAKANVLRVERSVKDKACLVKVNDTEVTRVPLGAAAGPFVSVELALAAESGTRGGFGGTAKRKSPQVTFVRVMPLEQPAPNP